MFGICSRLRMCLVYAVEAGIEGSVSEMYLHKKDNIKLMLIPRLLLLHMNSMYLLMW